MRRIIFVFSMILGLSAIAAAQGTSICQGGIASLRGTYLVSYEGWLTIPDPTNPYAAPALYPGAILGVMSIETNGKLSGTVTVAVFNEVAEYENEGTVTLNDDCTGELKYYGKIKGSPSGTQGMLEIHKFIAVDNGADLELHVIMKSVPGVVPVVLGKWKRIAAYRINAAVW